MRAAGSVSAHDLAYARRTVGQDRDYSDRVSRPNGSDASVLTNAVGSMASSTCAVVYIGTNCPGFGHDSSVHRRFQRWVMLGILVVERPEPTSEHPQHLSLEECYDNPTRRQAAAEHSWISHFYRIGEKSWRSGVSSITCSLLGCGTHPCCAILVRCDRKAQNCANVVLPVPGYGTTGSID
jgi:hypothetical protein